MRAGSLLKKCFHSNCMMFVQRSMMINAFNYVTLWHKLQYPHCLLLESGANLECLVLSAGPCICEAWIPFYNDIAMLKGITISCGNMLSHYIMALLKEKWFFLESKTLIHFMCVSTSAGFWVWEISISESSTSKG